MEPVMDVDARALYVISVAAELAGVHPQTLRIYERKGLLAPARTTGRSRRYSDRDIALLRRIQELTSDGVSLAGVQRILALEDDLVVARGRIAELETRIDALADELAGDGQPGEGYLSRAGRIGQARRQAEEIVLAEVILLEPEPGTGHDDRQPRG